MRKKVYIYMIDQNHTAQQTATHWKGRGPVLETMKKWELEFRLYGTYKKNQRPNKRGGTIRIPPAHISALETIFAGEPRLYLDEAADLLYEMVGHQYDISTISRTLHADPPHGLSRSRQVLQRRAREADATERRLFLKATRGISPAQMIWLDESHCDPKSCNRSRGYQRRGQGRHHHVLENFGPATVRYSLLAAANIDGFVIDACEAVEGGVDAKRFVKWVTQRLAPVLGSFARGERNSVVILDNASVHHSLLPIVEALICECGAIIIFLSPYSPDLNPIEQGFNRLKAFFKRRRSFDPSVLAAGLRSVTAAHMRSFCRHSGIVVVDPAVAAAAVAAEEADHRALLLVFLLD